MKILLYLPLILFAIGLNGQENAFVKVEGDQFTKGNRPYYITGTNLWFGMSLGSTGEGGDRERLIAELDALQALGINNVRVMAGSEGPADEPWRQQPALQNSPGQLDEALLEGLDFLLIELGKREITAVLVLNNFFQWSGGMAQYVSWASGQPIPYPHDEAHNWDEFQLFSAQFYGNKKAKKYFKQFTKQLLKRKNSINGLPYREDPTIMAWQLANEPRGFNEVPNYIRWADKTAGYIKRMDKNHLVSLGGEGKTSSEYAGTNFEKVSRSDNLDYLTAHLWIENWSWYQPKAPSTFEQALTNALAYVADHVNIAEQLNKPIVFEEFGVSRDLLDYDPSAPTTYRDRFYQSLFDTMVEHAKKGTPLMGSNFWSWSGQGRPNNPSGFWSKGDDFIGDPPHENQGWYSVYDTDKSTLKIIQNYTGQIRQLLSSKGATSAVDTGK